MSDLPSRLRADLTTAMRERDRATARLLRTVLSAIGNAEALPAGGTVGTVGTGESPVAGAAPGVGATEAPRRDLTAHDVLDVVRAERDERLAAADDLAQRGATEAAQTLVAEAAVLEGYLH